MRGLLHKGKEFGSWGWPQHRQGCWPPWSGVETECLKEESTAGLVMLTRGRQEPCADQTNPEMGQVWTPVARSGSAHGRAQAWRQSSVGMGQCSSQAKGCLVSEWKSQMRLFTAFSYPSLSQHPSLHRCTTSKLDLYTGCQSLGEQEVVEPNRAFRVLILIFQMAAHLSFPARSLKPETFNLFVLLWFSVFTEKQEWNFLSMWNGGSSCWYVHRQTHAGWWASSQNSNCYSYDFGFIAMETLIWTPIPSYLFWRIPWELYTLDFPMPEIHWGRQIIK